MKEVKKNYVKLSMMAHSTKENRDLLNSGAHLLGVRLDTTMVEVFERFLDELRKWNQRMNLTALRDERAIIVRHFLDSLILVEYLPQAASLMDIGSGAGFPGLCLCGLRRSLAPRP